MKLGDHWAVTDPFWAHGDSVIAWHVVFGGQLDFLANWLAPLLDRPFLTPVPPEWLHLTVKAVGPVGDVSEARLAELVEEAAAACAPLAPIDALVGPVQVVEHGVSGDVEPVEAFAALYDAVPGVGGTELRPHVTFAYANAAAEMEPIEVVASDAVLVRDVTLLRLRRRDRLYTWDVLATVPLAGAA